MTEPTREQEMPALGGPAGGEKHIATQPAGSLAIRGDDWTDDQRAVLRAMGLEPADEGDLKLFHHYAQRTGLDPFTRQVYMIGRDTEITVRERNEETGNERNVKRRVTRFTIQVGIDGWRVLGNRAAHRAGVLVSHEDVLWRGKGTDWRDYWDDDDGPPLACKYVLVAGGARVSATVHYSEYVQTVTRDGRTEPNSVWKKMPANQIAKVCESLAWRKAFPADFAGLVLEDAAQAEVIDGSVVEDGPVRAAPKRARGAERNRERAHRAAEQPAAQLCEVGGQVESRRPDEDRLNWSDEARRKWLNRLFDLLGEVGLGGDEHRDDQLVVIAELAGLSALPEHRDGMTDKALEVVVTKLNAITKAAVKADDPKSAVDAAVDDVLRSWEFRQAAAAEADEEQR